jgi:exosortase A-associated hydrolase 1
MDAIDRGLTFRCEGEELVGIVTVPSSPMPMGVLIVVGGPQYRVGSHRQFNLLARSLAREGFAAMRFDYRGMGDSGGPRRSFEDVSPDIAAAITAFLRECPVVSSVVLWGLCDAASAALMYMAATEDARIAGVALFNPWVRSDSTLARARIKHYYLRRLVAPDFWRKALRGRLGVGSTLRGLAGDALDSLERRGDARDRGSFRDVMEQGLGGFDRPVLLVLSGRDLTAREFEDHARTSGRWSGLLARPTVEHRRLNDADHTFSSARWRADVEQVTLDWLRRRVCGA